MTRLLLLPLAALSGCFVGNSGDSGHADFSWDACLLGCALSDHSMAAGGAAAGIHVTLHSGQPQIAQVASSDPSVVTFARDPQNADHVTATSAQPGSADLILKDSTGAEIDRSRVTVKPTTELAYDHAWDVAGPPSVLVGATDELHTTTKNGSEILIGSGAVKFTPSGAAMKGTGIILGDSFSFTSSAAGQGSIAADCIDSHIVVPIDFVDASAITDVTTSVPSLTFAKAANAKVDVTTKAGPTVVFDALCAWTAQPAGLTFTHTAGGTIGTAQAQTWQVSGQNAGNYTATCTVPGGKSATLTVTVN